MKRRSELEIEMSRRDFFRRAACAGVGTVAIASTIRDLRLMSAAYADSPDGSYKALVCLFLSGGNDSNNVLIPTDAARYGAAGVIGTYVGGRKALALPLPGATGGALPLSTVNTGTEQTYGIHPAMSQLQALYDAGKAAFVCNVGTLVHPMNRTQYYNNSVPKPPQLYSHNDQVVQWQTSVPGTESRTGWGGRMADAVDLWNDVAPGSGQKVSMCISLNGLNTFEAGNTVSTYSMGTGGPVTLSTSNSTYGSTADVTALQNRMKAINDLALVPSIPASPQVNLYERTYARKIKDAVDNAAVVTSAIATQPTWTTPFQFVYNGANTGSGLMDRMRMIARLINARAALGHKRQIFFVQVGGYDLHDGQVGGDLANPNTNTGPHHRLLAEVSQAIKAFYDATVQMGRQDDVTLYTASDFSRTFGVNGGVGSDHAWGSNQIVVGGAVNGARLYGAYPNLRIAAGSSDYTNQNETTLGRWIPTTAVDQLASSIALWFGVSPGQLSTILPNIGHFPTNDLGIFTPPPAPAATPATVQTKPKPVKKPVSRK